MLSREDLALRLREYLEEMFEVPVEKIKPEARLYEDLDLDSIDAINLVVKLQELTERKLKVDEFKTVRTVDDLVDRVYVVLAG